MSNNKNQVKLIVMNLNIEILFNLVEKKRKAWWGWAARQLGR